MNKGWPVYLFPRHERHRRWPRLVACLVTGMALLATQLLIGHDNAAVAARALEDGNPDRIRPWEENPYFWQYKGEPVLLIGASDQDNLFNHPDIGPDGLENHLDVLAASGGNYVRNTMNSGNEGNLWPHARDEASGLYDLDRFGEGYWNRFADLLRMAHERDIIIQIEVFDRFNFARSSWERNPFNPKNNINYTAGEIGLPETVDSHPGHRENPFFRSPPSLEDNRPLLAWQEAFVEKLLSISLEYGNVLYCISNETNDSEEWSRYWAEFIRAKAAQKGVGVEVTEMWDPWDLSHPMHGRTIDHPELYSFIDISQNNHQTGQSHWDNAQRQRQRIAGAPRPINNVKMYGGTIHGGGYEEGLRKLWRNVLGGMASARYHRPGEWTPDGPLYGAGLSEEAQAHLRGVRLIMDEIGWPAIEPGLDFVERVVDPKGRVRTERTHVVYTRAANGEARMYINGEEAASGPIPGELSSWEGGMRLALADEVGGGRPWLGAYHHVAVYSRALEPSEIAAHHAAGAPRHLDALQARYAFDEGEGGVIRDVSGREPALDLHIEDNGAAVWVEDGLEIEDSLLIATENPAERLQAAVDGSNAFTLEAWITPSQESQTGPARIVTMSEGPSSRNFTLGQTGNFYEMRLRTTGTTANGVPALQTGDDADASIAAARSLEGTRAAIFVSHGSTLSVDWEQLAEGLQAEWFNPLTAERQPATAQEGHRFQPPSAEDWLLILK